MGTNEMPMSSNVPVVVGDSIGNRTFQSEEEHGLVEPTERVDTGSSDHKNEVSEEEGTAERILVSAKEEGFEETLVHLAEGDFDNSESQAQTDELTKDSEEKTLDEVSKETGAKEAKKEAPETDKIDAESNQDKKLPEREAIVGIIKDLESQVEGLEGKNKELFERVKVLETNNTLAMQTLLEMTMVLHEMLKDEEDDEKKVSMLEVLIEMMANLMKAMFVPENENAVAQTVHTAGKQKETVKKGSKRSIDEIVRVLRERGTIRPVSLVQQENVGQESMKQAA